MTPADLRALAARVVAGKPSRELDADIAVATDYMPPGMPDWLARWEGKRQALPNLPGHVCAVHLNGAPGPNWPAPRYTTSLDAADLPWMPLRERGWQISVDHEGDDVWGASARIPVADDEEAPEMFEMTRDAAPAEPQARIALALLCMAAEGER